MNDPSQWGTKNSYFFATVLQFQIHRAICKAALQYDPNDEHKPLHKCDIYRQPVAGNILK